MAAERAAAQTRLERNRDGLAQHRQELSAKWHTLCETVSQAHQSMEAERHRLVCGPQCCFSCAAVGQSLQGVWAR
jgi:hypothetical protein